MMKSTVTLIAIVMFATACGAPPATSTVKDYDAASRLMYRCADPQTADTGYSVLLFGSKEQVTKARVYRLSFAGGELVGEYVRFYIVAPQPGRPEALTVFHEPALADAGYKVELSHNERGERLAAVAKITFVGEDNVAKLSCADERRD